MLVRSGVLGGPRRGRWRLFSRLGRPLLVGERSERKWFPRAEGLDWLKYYCLFALLLFTDCWFWRLSRPEIDEGTAQKPERLTFWVSFGKQ